MLCLEAAIHRCSLKILPAMESPFKKVAGLQAPLQASDSLQAFKLL